MCIWTEDWRENWHTECGHKFFFESGDPDENEFVFCPYCGEEIDAEHSPE